MKSNEYPDCYQPSGKPGLWGEKCRRYLDPAESQIFDRCYPCPYGGSAHVFREELVRKASG